MCSPVQTWEILGARLCLQSTPSLPFFSSTVFTCMFLLGLALCSLFAVSFSYFRHSKPKFATESQALFPSFFYLNFRLVINSAVKMQW